MSSDRYDNYQSPSDLINNAKVKEYLDNYNFDINNIKNTLLSTYELTLNKFYPKYAFNQLTNKREDNPDRKLFKGKLEEIIFRIKAYTLLNPKSLEHISDSIAQDTLVTDFILSLRSSFFLSLSIPTYQKESFLSKLADYLYVPNTDRTILPKNILDRISPYNQDTLIEILRTNDFLIPLVLINLLLSITDIDSL